MTVGLPDARNARVSARKWWCLALSQRQEGRVERASKPGLDEMGLAGCFVIPVASRNPKMQADYGDLTNILAWAIA